MGLSHDGTQSQAYYAGQGDWGAVSMAAVCLSACCVLCTCRSQVHVLAE
jgi:hypothetical protein